MCDKWRARQIICRQRQITEIPAGGQGGKKATLGGAVGEIIKVSRGDKVNKSNLVICDPITTATLCVCREQFVSFGTD